MKNLTNPQADTFTADQSLGGGATTQYQEGKIINNGKIINIPDKEGILALEGEGGNAPSGLSIYNSSEYTYAAESTAKNTTTLQTRYITIPENRQLQIGDLIIARYYYLYRITAVSTDRVTVTYLHPIAPIISSINTTLA